MNNDYLRAFVVDSAENPEEDNPVPNKKKRNKYIIILLAILLKLKTIIFLLPKLKFLTSSLTMVVSIAAYALFWGWYFAIGFVLLLFVHEMGHVIQLRREGIDAGAPMFIPFLGAVVAMKELPDDAISEARVGIAGPILGSVAALACYGIFLATGNEMFQALAYVGFFLNLFNLIPMLPLDGGRIMAAVSPKFWFLGLVMILGFAIVWHNPIIILILLFGLMEGWARWKRRNEPKSKAYYEVSNRSRILMGLAYVILVALLSFGMIGTYVPKSL